MSKGRCPAIRLLILFIGISGLMGAQTPPSGHTKRAKKLDAIIQHIDLTDGFESVGGASMEDATNLLREKTAFPVALEMVEFERPKDFITLDEALAKLHSMQAVAALSARDKARLDRYTEMAKSHPGTEVLVPQQRTFTFVQDRITVRDLLDQVIRQDDEYEWKNYGTEGKPLIVIHPRANGALNWRVSPICKPRLLAIEQCPS